MQRTLADIRDNLPHVGCDNDTALEMCAEIERLRALVRPLEAWLDRQSGANSAALYEAARNYFGRPPVIVD